MLPGGAPGGLPIDEDSVFIRPSGVNYPDRPTFGLTNTSESAPNTDAWSIRAPACTYSFSFRETCAWPKKPTCRFSENDWPPFDSTAAELTFRTVFVTRPWPVANVSSLAVVMICEPNEKSVRTASDAFHVMLPR